MKNSAYCCLAVALMLTTFTSMKSAGNHKPLKKKADNMRTYLALGDSYTIGECVPHWESYPIQTSALLNNDSVEMAAPEIIATTGWTTMDLANAIKQKNPKGPFSAVSLLIGVNDQYRFQDTAGYRERFTSLLKTAIRLSGNVREHVFVLSIPDYSVTPFAAYADKDFISSQIDEFNAINKEVTIAHHCNYIDITNSTKLAKDDASLLARDGLHPSGKEYAVWANMLAPMMKQILIK